MPAAYNLTLEPADVFQILDALGSRAEAYERTAASLRGDSPAASAGMDALDAFFVPEECRDDEEADEIARHFRDIIVTIERQLEAPR